MQELESQRKMLALERELFDKQRGELQTEKEMLRSVTSVMNSRLMMQVCFQFCLESLWC